MTQYEYAVETMPPGTLVRYVPHGADHERPPKDQPGLAPYWDITGCVMTLCNAADTACKARYLAGVYDRQTGRSLDWRDGASTSGPPLIDGRTKMRLPSPPAAGPS
jgi:hypothetical protein